MFYSPLATTSFKISLGSKLDHESPFVSPVIHHRPIIIGAGARVIKYW